MGAGVSTHSRTPRTVMLMICSAMTTTTMWLDARPTSLSPDTPAIPTGDFQIPLNQTAEIKNCIGSSLLTPAWGCMDIAYIGIDIFRPSPNAPVQAVFEDFSVNTANFRYGPQPPDFNGTAFDLEPMSDKDNDWGVAMFFSVLFDKLSIRKWALSSCVEC